MLDSTLNQINSSGTKVLEISQGESELESLVKELKKKEREANGTLLFNTSILKISLESLQKKQRFQHDSRLIQPIQYQLLLFFFKIYSTNINILQLSIKIKIIHILFTTNNSDMGRVRTKTVKRAAKVLLERHYQKLTSDFHINKRILSEVAKVPTKRLRNKIAGFATHLVKRIQKGPVKGISLKVQQQERERRLDWVPKESEIKLDRVAIDAETQNMLRARYGEELLAKLQTNLDVKASQVQKDKSKAKRRNNKKEGGARPQREKPEKTAQEGENKQKRQPRQPRQPKQNKQAGKRQGRKRGTRQGQQ